MSEEMTFEEFNNHIDEAHDEGCTLCFSFHHFVHLDKETRLLAYLDFTRDPSYYQALAYELEKREDLPLDDNIYWMVMNLEPMVELEPELSTQIMIQVLRRANEMVSKKMPNAWVAVRSYCWMKNNDPLLAYAMLESTEDLDVWQVVFQTTAWDIPKRENYKSLCLSSMRNTAYLYAYKTLDMEDTVKNYVVAVNAVKALAALQDDRAIEIYKRLPRHTASRILMEDIESQIHYLIKNEEGNFVPTLEKLLSLCRSKP